VTLPSEKLLMSIKQQPFQLPDAEPRAQGGEPRPGAVSDYNFGRTASFSSSDRDAGAWAGTTAIRR
jgi:hypothetical protein